MRGMDRKTGKALSGVDHLRQSVADILTTPIGSRVERRNYGSRLFELLDRPVNAVWLSDCYAYVAEAIDRLEPRLAVSSVSVSGVTDGHPTIDIYGVYRPDGTPVRLEGIVL